LAPASPHNLQFIRIICSPAASAFCRADSLLAAAPVVQPDAAAAVVLVAQGAPQREPVLAAPVARDALPREPELPGEEAAVL
jgi:hypothetical protein